MARWLRSVPSRWSFRICLSEFVLQNLSFRIALSELLFQNWSCSHWPLGNSVAPSGHACVGWCLPSLPQPALSLSCVSSEWYEGTIGPFAVVASACPSELPPQDAEWGVCRPHLAPSSSVLVLSPCLHPRPRVSSGRHEGDDVGRRLPDRHHVQRHPRGAGARRHRPRWLRQHMEQDARG